MKLEYNKETKKLIEEYYKRSLFRLYLPFIFILIIFVITILYGDNIEYLNEKAKNTQTGYQEIDSFLKFIYSIGLVLLDFIVDAAKIINLFVISLLLIKDSFKFIIKPNQYNDSKRNKIHSILSLILSCIVVFLLDYHSYLIDFIKEFI